jgi:hypothetical protein
MKINKSQYHWNMNKLANISPQKQENGTVPYIFVKKITNF